MSEIVFRNSIRAIVLLAIQILIFKDLVLGEGIWSYIHVMIYPLIILLLPLRMPNISILVLSFFIGLFVDVFYDSIGVHAGALVFTAYLRSFVLRAIEPYEGYNVNLSPTLSSMGLPWFLNYSSILLFGHLFIYFSLEAFTFVHLGDILLNTIFSFLLSFVIIMLHQWILKPKV